MIFEVESLHPHSLLFTPQGQEKAAGLAVAQTRQPTGVTVQLLVLELGTNACALAFFIASRSPSAPAPVLDLSLKVIIFSF